MASPPSLWTEPPNPQTDRKDPFLRLHSANVFVSDIERSMRFYLDQLGFTLAYDAEIAGGDRWVAVAPAESSSVLALVQAKPDSEEFHFVGRSRLVTFAVDDVQTKFEEWRERGVCFGHPPVQTHWGGRFTQFEDPDGNSFALVSHDSINQAIAAQRLAVEDKLEQERRMAQELDIAKQVQARLFPQIQPTLPTLDYAGVCVQARHVGGDYYDFLDLGHGRLGLVIGDISGKGIAAALLMAHLQANLRSQSAVAFHQPQLVLESVNRHFLENTSDSAYATLFFADYDEQTRTVRYANCGHLPGLLLRADGALERLDSTCTVIGLFKDWECRIAERRLAAGDTLVLYTDGVTEAFNSADEEFGEQGLVDALRRYRDESPKAVVAHIVEEVEEFSATEQHDDITLIIAKAR